VKRHNIEFMRAWLDALRRHDSDTLAAALDPAVVWQGLREDLVCHGPHEVLEGFTAARDEGFDIDLLELVGGEAQVVLGVRRPDLREFDGIELHGEIYNVFTIEGGMITRIEDYADRGRALEAAGLRPV
jgi:ketosteroid isomerase-like protein